MDLAFLEQVQNTLDELALARTQARHVTRTMRKQDIHLGLSYSNVEDDIEHIIGKLRYIKRVAEIMTIAETATERDKTPDENP